VGADISFVVEQTVTPAGPWVLATRPGSSSLDWYDERRYELFSLLTGLDFSARTLRPLTPVAALRGWPPDLSRSARERLVSWSDDTSFGRSWLDASDFGAYDWDANMTWTFMASPPREVLVTDEVSKEVTAYLEEHRHLPSGWSPAGWSRDGFEVCAETTPREQSGRFLEVMKDMTELAGENPGSVRCVFEFTR